MPGPLPAAAPSVFNICAYFLDRPAAEHPRRAAILGEPSQITYAELAALASRVAGAVTRDEMAPGDRVLIVLPDSAEFVAAFFGVAKTGAISVPVNPMTREADYAHFVRDSGARLAIVHAMSLEAFMPAAAGAVLEGIIVVGASAETRLRSEMNCPEMRRWEEWLAPANHESQTCATRATDPAFFLYTSGSGGAPKGAVHAHKDMLACARGYAQGVLGILAGDITYSVSKLFFAYGLGNAMYFPFSVGAATVLDPERPRPERAAAILARYRPTVFFSVPTFYAAVLREAEKGIEIDFSSVRLAVSAGERLPPEIFERFRARFGLGIVDGIGSTEMLQMFLSARPGAIRPGSCGTPVPGYDAKILDDGGAPAADGEIGNLWVRGDSAFSEYWKIPELTTRVKDGEWVLTGDKFQRDPDGYYHYCGRADDMMKVAGQWVSPGEVENVLLGHTMVAEAAVVALLDETGLARPLAFVVLREGSGALTETAEELRKFVRGRLPGYKCPCEVRLLDALPKTATGKIQRFLLREASR